MGPQSTQLNMETFMVSKHSCNNFRVQRKEYNEKATFTSHPMKLQLSGDQTYNKRTVNILKCMHFALSYLSWVQF